MLRFEHTSSHDVINECRNVTEGTKVALRNVFIFISAFSILCESIQTITQCWNRKSTKITGSALIWRDSATETGFLCRETLFIRCIYVHY